MALQQNGNYRYGDSQADLREELSNFSRACGYPATHLADAICVCGGRIFTVLLDDDEGVAIRVCRSCGVRHEIGDSKEYLADAEPEECQCPCGGEAFEVTAGVALYAQSEDVRWFYLGLRCVACRLTAVYGDWKNEFIGYQTLLGMV